MIRIAEAREFMARAGWADAGLQPIPGDASFRRYARLRLGHRSAILMDAPPPEEDVRPFLAIAGLLREWGFSAPDCLAADPGRGLLLLEDLGDARYGRILADDPGREIALYREAVSVLLKLQTRTLPRSLALPGIAGRHRLMTYDDTVLGRELGLFAEWYLPARDGGRHDDGTNIATLFAPLFAALATDRQILVLRDYHADNLMWLAERQDIARVGLLDFQDALIGHPAYDLVSLLQDARRDVSPDCEAAMIEAFLRGAEKSGRPFDPGIFARDYAILGAQRAMKILGIFTRLDRRDGKSIYLGLLPRVQALLARNLAHPALSELRHWLGHRVGANFCKVRS